jgi:hypothetical protein
MRKKVSNLEKLNRSSKIKLGNRLKAVRHADVDGFKVELEFWDGKKGVVSLAHLFEKPKFLKEEILRGGFF